MKLYEFCQKVGYGLMLVCIGTGIGGITLTALGYIDECADLQGKNFCLEAVANHLDKENNKLKEEIKTLKEQAVEAVETVTKVREKKKVEA